jgi:tRNA threonylcarbamoyl adenosine modification protein (Sua5/YciO/YrdC/YwlC family)
MAEFIRLYPENPELKKIIRVAEMLKQGAVMIYPTDTLYGLGCDFTNQKAVDRVRKIKGLKEKETNLSFICYDLSHISEYAKQLNTETFKLMKRALPGPYTFILNASNSVPKILNAKKKTIGIRVPDNNIPREIVKELGNPIISTSIYEGIIEEYPSDPEVIYDQFKDKVDIIINGGNGNLDPSTIIDCTGDAPVLIREGIGDTSII